MKIVGRPSVSLDVVISLTEDEAGALQAISAYGDDIFIRKFYDEVGRSCLEPHEKGLRSLLTACSEQLGVLLAKAQAARKVFELK